MNYEGNNIEKGGDKHVNRMNESEKAEDKTENRGENIREKE